MALSQKTNRPIRRKSLEAEVYKALEARSNVFAEALAEEQREKLEEDRDPWATRPKRKKPNRTGVQLSLYMPPRLIAALEATVIDTGRTKRDIICSAVSDYCKQYVGWYAYDPRGQPDHDYQPPSPEDAETVRELFSPDADPPAVD